MLTDIPLHLFRSFVILPTLSRSLFKDLGGTTCPFLRNRAYPFHYSFPLRVTYRKINLSPITFFQSENKTMLLNHSSRCHLFSLLSLSLPSPPFPSFNFCASYQLSAPPSFPADLPLVFCLPSPFHGPLFYHLHLSFACHSTFLSFYCLSPCCCAFHHRPILSFLSIFSLLTFSFFSSGFRRHRLFLLTFNTPQPPLSFPRLIIPSLLPPLSIPFHYHSSVL